MRSSDCSGEAHVLKEGGGRYDVSNNRPSFIYSPVLSGKQPADPRLWDMRSNTHAWHTCIVGGGERADAGPREGESSWAHAGKVVKLIVGVVL